MADVSVLDVRLHGEPIATLTHVAGDRTLFAFNEAYISDRARPTLSLSFKDTLGGLITDFAPTRGRLLPVFANLLPEGHMRTYLAERAGVNPQREFFLLWALGRDLPGAITVVPAEGHAWLPNVDDGSQENEGKNLRNTAFRFSLAGVQLKFSALQEARGGLTIPAEGVGGSWIVKLPSREFAGVPENEFSMMTLARLIGMEVPPIELLDPADIGNLPKGIGELKGKALAIERFDRFPGGEAIQIEDFAQVFGVYPADKYKRASYGNIAKVIGTEGTDADVAEFIRRLTFNTLIGNADMHLKNWSLIYRDRRTASLAPAYDFVSTVSYLPDAHAALNFSRTKRFDGFTEDELSHLAGKALLSRRLVVDTALETVALFHERWRKEKKHLPISAEVAAAVEKQLKTVPLAAR